MNYLPSLRAVRVAAAAYYAADPTGRDKGVRCPREWRDLQQAFVQARQSGARVGMLADAIDAAGTMVEPGVSG